MIEVMLCNITSERNEISERHYTTAEWKAGWIDCFLTLCCLDRDDVSATQASGLTY
jgi:hypothetical protein